MQLEGRVALITGAAKRVGRAIAVSLAEAGADIAVHYRSSEADAIETANIVRALGRQAELFQADLADPPQIESLFSAIAETFGRLDVLVNSAAVYHRTPLESLTAEQWDLEMAVNARAPALCIRHAMPLFVDGGAIVNIADIAADKGWAGYPAYGPSKAALQSLTKAAAKALAARNIRVNAVAPGAILWQGESEALQQRVIDQVPLKRLGTPQDIANAVTFLAASDYITAQTLRVDGGWHMG